ncbi:MULTISPECIES: hypothetical protein [Leptospira]|uniref:Uncharacterized protein n=1 Tax=Leptospira borgpetersenii serovar Javanica str. UI 09931 TaxID=1049767 RepID=A0AAV3J972_LEPBO|nr:MULTISPECIES: hypothetical protein [Leptospira]AXX17429.1 hypothetical protein C4Q31_17845 [Leptospira borgpetersenii serovar Ceylonica]EKQ90517.1 hypothetical protein LEP1GSC101_0439 [Leptospira borgpetersenii str. UI 09149]EMK12901.1 hypothetical protein LEP1GSC066_1074 [Leptospira sp. serovar Kenya str. Sh9]EMN59774.1 hypothetical protein LEP1GSC090_2718 [Leptospira borgpetersenii serovar Javanica str. MK146]EPG56189.1 hypothetical protein LEP1GSC103_0665 [Leptospira borgpetersenii serov
MSKTEIEIVGQDGDKILYIQFFKGVEQLPKQLWKLQHPGNKRVDVWNEEMVRQKDGDLELKTSLRTERFFKECVFGIVEPATPLEEELVNKFGKTPTKSLKREDIPPLLYGLWGKLIPRFFDGALWDTIPESIETTGKSGDRSGNKQEDREE